MKGFVKMDVLIMLLSLVFVIIGSIIRSITERSSLKLISNILLGIGVIMGFFLFAWLIIQIIIAVGDTLIVVSFTGADITVGSLITIVSGFICATGVLYLLEADDYREAGIAILVLLIGSIILFTSILTTYII